ncbi:unnamed protein product [Parajaminaea phylloscopi]
MPSSSKPRSADDSVGPKKLSSPPPSSNSTGSSALHSLDRVFRSKLSFDRASRRQSHTSTTPSTYSTAPSSPTDPSIPCRPDDASPSVSKQPSMSRLFHKAANAAIRKTPTPPSALSKKQQRLLQPQSPRDHAFEPSSSQNRRGLDKDRLKSLLPSPRLGHKPSQDSMWGSPVSPEVVAMGIVSADCLPRQPAASPVPASTPPRSDSPLRRLAKSPSAAQLKRMLKRQVPGEGGTQGQRRFSAHAPPKMDPSGWTSDTGHPATVAGQAGLCPPKGEGPQSLPQTAFDSSSDALESGSSVEASRSELIGRISPFPQPPQRGLRPAVSPTTDGSFLAGAVSSEMQHSNKPPQLGPSRSDPRTGAIAAKIMKDRIDGARSGPRRPTQPPPPLGPLPPTPPSAGIPRLPQFADSFFQPLLPPSPISPVHSTAGGRPRHQPAGEGGFFESNDVVEQQAQSSRVLDRHRPPVSRTEPVRSPDVVLSSRTAKHLSWSSMSASNSEGDVSSPRMPSKGTDLARPVGIKQDVAPLARESGTVARPEKGDAASYSNTRLGRASKGVKDRPPTPGAKVKLQQRGGKKGSQRPRSPVAARGSFSNAPPVPAIPHTARRPMSRRRTSIYFLDPDSETIVKRHFVRPVTPAARLTFGGPSAGKSAGQSKGSRPKAEGLP